MDYFCTLGASLCQVVYLFIKIIVGHPFNTFIGNLPCSMYYIRSYIRLQIWDLGKGMNPSGLASSFLPNNKNVRNDTVVNNIVSSADRRRVFPSEAE